MRYVSTAVYWSNPLVHFIGLAIAIWAFRRARKKGYLVVAAYFILVLFSLLAMPKINRRIAIRHGQDLDESISREIATESTKAVDRVLKKHGRTYAPPPMMELAFPLGPVLLVGGLWLIARRERITEAVADASLRGASHG